MKKFFRALRNALFFTVALLAVIFFLIVWDGGSVKENIIEISPFLLAHFFVAPFLAFFFFDKQRDKRVLKIALGALLTFIVVYLIVYLKMDYDVKLIRGYGRAPFWNIVYFMNGVFGIFIYSFFIIGQFISLNTSGRKYNNYEKIKFSPSFILIPLIGSIIYTLIFNLEVHPVNDMISIFFILFTIGLLISFLTVFILNKVYSTYEKVRLVISVIGFYIGDLLFALVLFSILFYYMIDKLVAYSISPAFIPYFIYVILVSHLYFLNILNKKEKEAFKKQSLQSQINYQQLKNQLSPHFLFNNINVLTSLIEENPQKAVVFSEKLSNIYRYFLEQEKQDVVKLSEEITFAKDYLHLLKSRFEEGLTFQIDLSEDSLQKFIASTSLQQILENSIKHNEVSEEKKLQITICSDADYLLISNNKNPKLSTEKSLQKGIENIKKRYAYFTDKKVMVLETDTVFTIKLPLLTVSS